MSSVDTGTNAALFEGNHMGGGGGETNTNRECSGVLPAIGRMEGYSNIIDTLLFLHKSNAHHKIPNSYRFSPLKWRETKPSKVFPSYVRMGIL